MKKKLLYLLPLLLVPFLFVSCEEEEMFFDRNLLIGTWESGTLYDKYNADGTGSTWDTSDDVGEDEAQAFTWTLVSDVLEQIHILEIGGTVPKVYTVTMLTATTLRYEDDFGKQFSFTKVD
ncbi:MAG: hypothetical protein ACOCX0_00965 [Bacteroidota bacterium]